MYYPKELFSINETTTNRNLAAYEAEQIRIYNECLRICPEYNSLGLKKSHGIRKYAENKLIYVPVFHNANWEVVEIDPTKARYFSGLDRYIIYFGTIYNADNLFATKDGAKAWIDKRYGIAALDSIEAKYIEWKESKTMNYA